MARPSRRRSKPPTGLPARAWLGHPGSRTPEYQPPSPPRLEKYTKFHPNSRAPALDLRLPKPASGSKANPDSLESPPRSDSQSCEHRLGSHQNTTPRPRRYWRPEPASPPKWG